MNIVERYFVCINNEIVIGWFCRYISVLFLYKCDKKGIKIYTILNLEKCKVVVNKYDVL